MRRLITHPAVAGRGWAYAGVALGGAVSIAANVAHSYVPPADAPSGWAPPSGAVIGAVFWPVALFVAIEILARTTWPDGRRWVALRFVGLLPVALVAAVVSYRHLSGLLAFYREDSITATFGPLAVDGLMVMATGALIASRRTTPADAAPVAATDSTPDTSPELVPDTRPEPVPDTARTPKRSPRRTAKPDIATAVVRLRQQQPELSASDIARRLKVSDRTVRRHLAAHANVPKPLSLTAA